MPDIIDFALQTTTDYKAFESLASEIMRDEGYPNIHPLGGVADFGQDAVVENLYLGEEDSRIVFQYTVDKKTESKIINTIDKLKENKIDFNLLVYVTSQEISTTKQTELKKTARKEHSVTIEFFERKTLKNRLSDKSNGIFERYFSDIDKQIATYRCNIDDIALKKGEPYEVELLKANLAFVFNKDAQKTRKALFDNIVVAIIYSHSESLISEESILDKLSMELKIEEIDKLRLKATIKRLVKKNIIEEISSKFKVTDEYSKTIELDCGKVQNKTSHLVDEILQLAIETSKSNPNDDTRRRAKRNIKNALGHFFSAFGTEIITQHSNKINSYPVFQKLPEEVHKICSHQLETSIGPFIFDSIAEILTHPTEQHVESLYNWMLAYAGKAIMNIDPSLKELQHTRFAKKVFALDTDYLINCVVQENDDSRIYIQLLKDIIKTGAKVVIPHTSIEECTTHARFSYKTYIYFGHSLFRVPKSAAREKIHNAFVRGYYYGILENKIPSTTKFNDYIQNYFNSESPISFMKEIIGTYLPEEIEIVDLEFFGEHEIEEEEYDKIFEEMYEFTLNSKGGKYRTEDENKSYAETDTLLFLAISKSNTNENNESILGGHTYLLTDSGRYRIISERLSYKDKISTRPQSLINIMKIVGTSTIHKKDVVKLMENPFIIHSVEQCWGDVIKLISTGIDASSITIPKLKYDLDNSLHDHISHIPDDELKKESEYYDSDEHKKLIEEADKLGGYVSKAQNTKLITEIQQDREQIKELEEELERYKKLEDEIDTFGKRRRKYLNKIIKRE